MKFLSVCLVVAISASCCLAYSLTSEAEEVKRMIMEYEPVVDSIASRMFQQGIEKNEVEADPIPAVAKGLGLSTLLDLVTKAGLAPVLSGKGPFTVFGPTNEAFANLPEWAKKEVQEPKVLKEVLTYHVLAAKVESKDLKNDLLATTVEGKKIRVNIYNKAESNAAVYTAQCAPIDLSKVDQQASNGVIHVLNSVMIPPSGNIVATVAACPAFKTLVKAVTVAGLASTLSGPGPFTLFAPTDKAFEKLPPGTLEKLIKNPKELAKILTYHVVPSTQCSAGLSSGSVKTVEGQDVTIAVSASGVEVNNAKVIYADGSVSNGVVHAIDNVLLPPGFEL